MNGKQVTVMKDRILYIISAAFLLGFCGSCQKEFQPLGEKQDGGTVVVKATIVQPSTKVTYTVDSGLKQSWAVNDNIVGWDREGNKMEFKISSADDIDGAVATFTLVNGVMPPKNTKVYMVYAPGKTIADIEDKSISIDISSQDQNALPALMTATGTVSNGELNFVFENKTAIVGVKDPVFHHLAGRNITQLRLAGSQTLLTVSLDGDNLQMSSSKLAVISSPCDFTTDSNGKTTDVEMRFVVSPTTKNLAVLTDNAIKYRAERTKVSLAAGHYYQMSPTLTVLDGMLPGVFTVGAGPDGVKGTDDDVKVRFSRGNLQLCTAVGIWRFAETQYASIGNASGNTTPTNRHQLLDWIDLFGWGATGFNQYGAKAYETSVTNSEYKTLPEEDYHEYLTLENGGDWAYCFGGEASSWRTMTQAEWKYLLDTRGKSGNKYRRSNVSVCGVYCLVIAPDGDTDDIPASFTASEWAAKEALGYVCLPVTGFRKGTDVLSSDTYGYYWASDVPGSKPNACCMYFQYHVSESRINFSSQERHRGLSVRLVADIN